MVTALDPRVSMRIASAREVLDSLDALVTRDREQDNSRLPAHVAGHDATRSPACSILSKQLPQSSASEVSVHPWSGS